MHPLAPPLPTGLISMSIILEPIYSMILSETRTKTFLPTHIKHTQTMLYPLKTGKIWSINDDVTWT